MDSLDDILGNNSSNMCNALDGDDSFKMDNQVDGKPEVGMEFDTLDDVWEFWQKYGRQMGFGVRKDYKGKSKKDGVLIRAVFVCYREGFRKEDKRVVGEIRSRWVRIGCKARLYVILERETGKFKVREFVEDHNHPLELPKTSPMLRSHRKMTKAQALAIELSCNSGFTPNATHGLMSREVDMSADHGTCHLHQKTSVQTIGSVISQNLTTAESQYALEHALAKRAVGLVKSGMVIGLGTGNTASIAIEELGKLIRQGLLKDIVAVGVNCQSRVVARLCGIKTVDLNDVSNIDISFDGADEVDFNKNLLKGGGGAHTMQKVIDSVAKECVIFVDHTKVVRQLGSSFPVPVEVLPLAISPVLRRLVTLGGVPEIRSALKKDGPVVTDLRNILIDVSFPNGIHNPADLEGCINMIPGVVENGIVSGTAPTVLVGIENKGNATVMTLEEFWNVVISHRDASSTRQMLC
ncbi:ribose-5-phosphate isomerase-like [Tripterygium wilfordii]|uniref:ribose-5-phosphate isomerase-like n=1 Tax=Tripterygium wilfordii TaxID=458696 RepID=UPI0018F842CA|nr:ribose-5-phosphate isomerase-like [Tripterygium wilfordii]XP_038694597.1 ribose-5-phosphate isomerase-like [Tripterygium wilfordii]